MAKRFYEAYAGMSQRDAQEASDASMIPSGSGKHANLPTEVVIKSYADGRTYMSEGLNDGITGVDSQINADGAQRNKNLKPKKV